MRPMPKPERRRFSTADRHAELVARALAHIDAALDQPLDAATLADRAAMSRFHFHRVFLAHVGCTVAAYLSWRRLQRACALLASGREPVLEIALTVGFESAQALAKAMRRELGATPTAVRRGDVAAWTNLLPPWRRPFSSLQAQGTAAMQATRFTELPEGIAAFTATAKGMVGHSLARAAQQAFAELVEALDAADMRTQVASWMCVVPDSPKGPDDPHCRYVAGVVFGHDMASGRGSCTQPDLALSGSLAWQTLAAGRYAVFTHIGPYDTLHQSWSAIYRDWLPSSGEQLRDVPPLELVMNNPHTTPPELLHTEIWLPLLEA